MRLLLKVVSKIIPKDTIEKGNKIQFWPIYVGSLFWIKFSYIWSCPARLQSICSFAIFQFAIFQFVNCNLAIFWYCSQFGNLQSMCFTVPLYLFTVHFPHLSLRYNYSQEDKFFHHDIKMVLRWLQDDINLYFIGRSHMIDGTHNIIGIMGCTNIVLLVYCIAKHSIISIIDTKAR